MKCILIPAGLSQLSTQRPLSLTKRPTKPLSLPKSVDTVRPMMDYGKAQGETGTQGREG